MRLCRSAIAPFTLALLKQSTIKELLKMDEEFELEMSPLCQEISDSGHTVKVEIYRGGGRNWHLKIVDEFGNSTVWEDQFPTDAAALEEALATIKDEGIGVLVGMPG